MDDQGSLRDAPQSLQTLLEIARTTQGGIHPDALRSSRSQPEFSALTDRLINEVLVTMLGSLVYYALDFSDGPGSLALYVALYTLTAYGDGRRSVANAAAGSSSSPSLG